MRIAVPDIFDEVEEDLRAEQVRNLFKRYGGLMVAAAVLLVAGVGAWETWKWYDARQVAQTAEHYAAAMKLAEGHPGPGRQAATPLFADIARDGANEGYRTLARLREAELKAEAGDLTGASALWTQVHDDSAADPLLRDVAGLQWAQHQVDSGDPSQVATRLRSLTRPDNPFRGLAEEAQALLDLRQDHAGAAREMLKQISHEDGAPEGVRQRAGSLLTQLGQTTPQTAKPSAGGYGGKKPLAKAGAS